MAAVVTCFFLTQAHALNGMIFVILHQYFQRMSPTVISQIIYRLVVEASGAPDYVNFRNLSMYFRSVMK